MLCYQVNYIIDNVYIDQTEHTSIILRSPLASRPISASSPNLSAKSNESKLTFSVLVGGTFREISAPIYDELNQFGNGEQLTRAIRPPNRSTQATPFLPPASPSVG
jgi:hypothetical protein